MNEYINITLNNIDDEHLCCAISDKKHQEGVMQKKEWLKERIKEGHVFRKLNANGKVFIEYAPLEKAWTPISGDKYIYIYCLWVAGSYKGKGYAKELLEYAINDAKKNGKNGLCTITTKKKKPFVSEKSFFEKYGFEVVDEVGEYQLIALKFNKAVPQFNDNARKIQIADKNLNIFYTAQCPFTMNCIEQIEEYAKENKVKIVFNKIDTLEKAKNVPCVFNNWANFKEGKYVSNALMNKNIVAKLYEK